MLLCVDSMQNLHRLWENIVVICLGYDCHIFNLCISQLNVVYQFARPAALFQKQLLTNARQSSAVKFADLATLSATSI